MKVKRIVKIAQPGNETSRDMASDREVQAKPAR